MNLKEKTPDKILINVDSLHSIISQDTKAKKVQKDNVNSRNYCFTYISIFFSCLLSTLSSWTNANIFSKIIFVISSSASFLLLLWYLIKYIQSKIELKDIPDIPLEEHILNDAKEKIRYTALLIICHQKTLTGEVKFMTEAHGNYIVHCDMDPNLTVYEQKISIINYLAATYNIQRKQIEDVFPLTSEPFFSIKPIHTAPTQNAFIFFQIKLTKKAKQSLLNHRNVTWKTIQEMEAMPELMGRNQDIVMALNESITKISDSFEDALSSHSPIHIIWNITKQCPYNCKICATRDDDRLELSTEQKLQVLDHIFSARERISTLDFAGGDPMFDQGIRSVILQAINSLGKEHVSVTTTGKGIQAMQDISEEEMSRLLRKCELTIDASHENLSLNSKKSLFSRNSPEYCTHNYTQIKSTSENFQNLIINIPIIDDDLTDDEINTLVDKLLLLRKEYSELELEAQLIRLMPVGAFCNSDMPIDDYKAYQPITVAQKLKTQIENNEIPCRYHCSLRVLPALNSCDSRCNMLDKKIGIDCSGNVFACTWGAYLRLPDKYDITHNPFYLGNLVSTDLKTIINGQENKTPAYKRITRDISNKTPKSYCETVSWFFKNTVDENHDPLSKIKPQKQ